MLKCIAFDVDGELGLAVVPGDRDVNEFALAAALAPKRVRLFERRRLRGAPRAPEGLHRARLPGRRRSWSPIPRSPRRSAGSPAPTSPTTTCATRCSVATSTSTCGPISSTIVTGDACPRCGEPLSVDRGIEVGHVFQLGTKYSIALDANYTDEHGEQHPMVMGCYGIGVSRVVAAIVEEHHDEHGIAWPAALAPYDVHSWSCPAAASRRPACSRRPRRIYEELGDARRRGALRRPRREPGREVRRRGPASACPCRSWSARRASRRGIVERKDRADRTRATTCRSPRSSVGWILGADRLRRRVGRRRGPAQRAVAGATVDGRAMRLGVRATGPRQRAASVTASATTPSRIRPVAACARPLDRVGRLRDEHDPARDREREAERAVRTRSVRCCLIGSPPGERLGAVRVEAAHLNVAGADAAGRGRARPARVPGAVRVVFSGQPPSLLPKSRTGPAPAWRVHDDARPCSARRSIISPMPSSGVDVRRVARERRGAQIDFEPADAHLVLAAGCRRG